LVGVKEAILNVPEFKKTIPSCVTNAYSSTTSISGLTHDEAAAIKTYTDACDVYPFLNTALRTEQPKRIEPWFAYLKLFHIGINKLPFGTGPFCRGENGPYGSSYKVGSVVTWVCEIIGKIPMILRTRNFFFFSSINMYVVFIFLIVGCHVNIHKTGRMHEFFEKRSYGSLRWYSLPDQIFFSKKYREIFHLSFRSRVNFITNYSTQGY
jgi:hypothetical protein